MLLLCFFFFLFWGTLLVSVSASVCTGSGADVQIYHDYFESECPAPFHMDQKNEFCQATDFENPLQVKDDDLDRAWHDMVWDIGGFCDSYCQIRTTFTYGQEQPIDTKGLCRGPGSCSIGSNDQVAYGWPIKHPNAPTGYHDQILDVGIDSGYNPTSGDSYKYADGRILTLDLKQGECAYFTFVPFVKATCGTYTRRDTIIKLETPPFGLPFRKIKGCENPRNSINVCAVQPIEQSAGDESKYELGVPPRTIQGRYLAVHVDCYTGQKLASAASNDILRHDGVSLPNDSPYWKTLTEHWQKTADHPEWRAYDEPWCHPHWKRNVTLQPRFDFPLIAGYTPDCIDAISSLRRSADLVFSSHDLSTVADWGHCIIRTQLDKNSNIPDCQYTYLEIAIAVEISRRRCYDGDRAYWTFCPRFPLYDKGNGCHGWVTITREARGKCW